MQQTEYPLIRFYKGWATYQRMLTEVVAPLSMDQLDLTIAPGKWTVGQLVQHIAFNRVWWFQLWMNQGDATLAPLLGWDPTVQTQPLKSSADELVAALAATWSMIDTALNSWTAADLAGECPVPTTLSAEEQAIFRPSTRDWIIWHVLEHEIHHGGEISLILGVNGLLGIYGDF